MAVDSYTYGVVAGLQRRVGWMVPDKRFSANTSPTLGEVEQILDQVASRIHMQLQQHGYPVNTYAEVLALSAPAARWLRWLNEVGAAGELTQMFPMEAMPDYDTSRFGHGRPSYSSDFKRGLQQIGTNALERLGLTKETESSSDLVCGSCTTTDGETKKPIFTRGMYDYPGTRSLVE